MEKIDEKIEKKRIFYAVTFSDDIKHKLYRVGENLVKYTNKGKWTTKNNFHLTTQFIGEVENEEIEKYILVGEKVSKNIREFSIETKDIQAFLKKKGIVIYISLIENKNLKKLYEELTIELKKERLIFDEKVFVPHITFGRSIKLDKTIRFINDNEKFKKININIKSFSIMESKRENDELVYSELIRFNL